MTLPRVPSIADFVAAYAGGSLTPAAAIDLVLARIAAGDPAAWIAVRDRADLLAEAAALGPRDDRPLWGVPFAVKDNIDVAGVPTTAACPAFAFTPERDATVVARLRAAGAIPVGKTNLDQFATGLVGVRSPTGTAADPARRVCRFRRGPRRARGIRVARRCRQERVSCLARECAPAHRRRARPRGR